MLKSTLDAQHNLWSKQTDLKAPALNSRGDPSGNLFVQRREKECPAARSILKEAWQTWMEVQTASKLARQDLLMVIWSPFSQNIRLEASDLNTNSHVQKKGQSGRFECPTPCCQLPVSTFFDVQDDDMKYIYICKMLQTHKRKKPSSFAALKSIRVVQ